MDPQTPDVAAIATALGAPFDPREVKWKAQTVSGNRALAVCFVDARVVQDRLDDVLGVLNWQDHYDLLPEGTVVCRLKIRIGSEWIAKEDVGGESGQPDEGDRRKAAFSDALKRAAVKFGIGRYLYRLKPQWVGYDPTKRQLLWPGGKPPAPGQPAQQAAAKKESSPAPAPPKPPPEQPYDRDEDPDALLSRTLAGYLEWLRASRGVNRDSLLEKFGVQRYGQMTVKQYREAIARLSKMALKLTTNHAS